MKETTKEKIDIKKVARIARIVLVLAVVLFGVGWLQYLRVREFKGYEAKSETSLYSGLTGYQAGNGRFFAYSNDGARALDGDGAILWEASYQLDNPQLAYCKDVAAVADVGGTGVYVIAENGIPYD